MNFKVNRLALGFFLGHFLVQTALYGAPLRGLWLGAISAVVVLWLCPMRGERPAL
jgi:hypothetical protein